MKFVYLNDYNEKEEATISAQGVTCYRMSSDSALTGKGFDQLPKTDVYQIRSNRLSVDDYSKIWSVAKEHGITLTTNPTSYEIGSSFKEQRLLLRALSPNSLVLDSETKTNEIREQIELSEMNYPIFVRSEIESAAKYVGVDGCVINENTTSSIENVVENLKNNVRGFRTLILKEMLEIARNQKTNKHIEYRAIGVNGGLLFFDYDPGSGLQDPYELNMDEFATEALMMLSDGGAKGGLFVDIALTEEGKKIVVECKNLVNGTIKQLDKLADAVINNG